MSEQTTSFDKRIVISLVDKLCKKVGPHMVIALAAATIDWKVYFEKPKNSSDTVLTGLIVGTQEYINDHTKRKGE